MTVTTSDVVSACVQRAAAAIRTNETRVRAGDDAEALHQARVGTRRLRSDLRTFGSWIDADAAAPVRDELRWLAGRLGAVRDADVLRARLEGSIAHLRGEDGEAAVCLLHALNRERDASRHELLATLDDERYERLVTKLEAWVDQPPVADALPAKPRAAAVVRRPWRRLRASVAELPTPRSEASLHDVRIRTKRARYAAEATSPLLGDRAGRLATRLARLQDVLGEFQDATVAEVWLRRAAIQIPTSALAAGQLIASERLAAAAAVERWPAAWSRVEKAGRWLS